MQVFVDEVGDNPVFEFLPDIQDMVLESQVLGHSFGFKQGVYTATAFLFSRQPREIWSKVR